MLNYEYLLTTIGALKLLHVVFGVLSLGLIADSFIPVTEEIVFLSVVLTIFLLSFLYLLFHLAWTHLISNKVNARIDFGYHIVAGILLVVSGIDVTTWDDYFAFSDNCSDNCPSLYTKGVAKIFTFINGVLYGIVAFISVKEEALLKEEELTESDLEDFEELPLLVKGPPRIYRKTKQYENNNF